MEESDLAQIYDKRLLTKGSLSTYMLLIIYIPIGISLICLRIVLSFVSTFLVSLSPSLKTSAHFVNLYANLMGVYASLDRERAMSSASPTSTNNETPTSSSSSNSSKRGLLYVSNHRSELDLLAVKSCVPECGYIPESNHLSSLARTILAPVLTLDNNNNNAQRPIDMFGNVKNYPLVAFAEQMPTKSTCLLTFDSVALSATSTSSASSSSSSSTTTSAENDIQMQPLAIQLRRPVLPLCVNHSNRALSTLVMLFSPVNLYRVAVLQPQPSGDSCRQVIAAKLGATLSLFNHEDVNKALLNKYNRRTFTRRSNEQTNGNRAHTSIGFTETSKLALQIKDILPNASYELIQRHIQQAPTLDIDTVLASILDDEQLQQENNAAAASGAASTAKSSSSSPSLLPTETPKPSHSLQHATKSTSALLTTTTTKSRFKSYEERKFDLLNDARRRFLLKNPL